MEGRRNRNQIVVLGVGSTGKSAITIRLLGNEFLEEYDPTIEDSYVETVNIDGKDFVLDILDTAGQDAYSAMRDEHIRIGKAFIFVYDITSRKTFDAIGEFYLQLCSVKQLKREPVRLVILGNKSDREVERQVLREDGEDLGNFLNAPFFECSAATNTNIKPAFGACVQLIDTLQNPTRTRKANKECCIS